DQVVLVAATAPRRAHRALARSAAPDFLEVWVRTPREICEQRDVKGLYARAHAGDAPTLPGVGGDYEPPLAPEVVADGGLDDGAIEALLRSLVGRAKRA
ncbi:MAG: adenylyl-sulfate kinase, partial [Deltaproteobacteria bacterium]|nr:adenylyl-sulfate kinase [Deltaproteobacteria bacterium]